MGFELDDLKWGGFKGEAALRWGWEYWWLANMVKESYFLTYVNNLYLWWCVDNLFSWWCEFVECTYEKRSGVCIHIWEKQRQTVCSKKPSLSVFSIGQRSVSFTASTQFFKVNGIILWWLILACFNNFRVFQAVWYIIILLCQSESTEVQAKQVISQSKVFSLLLATNKFLNQFNLGKLFISFLFFYFFLNYITRLGETNLPWRQSCKLPLEKVYFLFFINTSVCDMFDKSIWFR